MIALLKSDVANPGKGRGQPTRYCDELRAAICRDIEQGVPVSKAFLCNGICPRTGFNWIHSRPEFALAVDAARRSYQGRQKVEG